MNRIIWLTGPSEAGKTTLAKKIAEKMNAIILDGDEMRNSISEKAGYSREDRTEHNLRVARLARVLGEQGNVIVSVIAPIAEVRERITEICHPLWIYVKRTVQVRKDHFYEESTDYFVTDHDTLDIAASTKRIMDYIRKPKYSLLIGRYQPLHDGHKALIQKILDEGKNVVVGLRDTPITEIDPYTLDERIVMFHEAFNSEIDSNRLKVITLPDIEEVCWGRGVGWERREIHLDKKIESISATAIRNEKEK